jgi:hypothetical protein
MANKIFGVIQDFTPSGAPIKGLRVRAWDEDWPDGDDFMGEDITGSDGAYQIVYRMGHWDRSIAGRPTWRPDIFVTVDIKNEMGKWVHIAKSRVHKDHDLNEDLRIDLKIDLAERITVRTNFLPEQHGFHFNNLFVVKPDILGIDLGRWQMGFCGGMCSGALHRYRMGLEMPKDMVAPVDGTALHEELKKRQIVAMSPEMLPMMYDWQSAPDVATPMRKPSIAKRTQHEWPKLQAMLDSGQPAILVLIRSSGYFGNPTRNHQVLAIGYDFDPATRDLVIHTYDPNQHDKTNTISLNVGLPQGSLFIKDSASRSTRGFFVSPVGEEATALPVANGE